MKNFMKKRVALVAGTLALVAFAGIAQAETRLAVQNVSGTDKMVVTDSGFVGIGTNTPTTGIHMQGASIEQTQIRTHLLASSSTLSGGIAIMRNKGDMSLPLDRDRLGYLVFGGVDGVTNKYSAAIYAYADGNWTSSSTPSYYAFETTKAGKSTRDEWFRITSNGNIGVNTPAPNMQLEVNGGLRLNPAATLATVTSPARTKPVQPACDNTNGPLIRGTMWFTNSAPAAADLLQICSKDSSDNYQWRTLALN